MRIVAGEFGGRRIDAPEGRTTRPTNDRVREGVFSALLSLTGPRLGDARVLDAFAGSGALGLEAISRGAASATFVEKDRLALQTLERNISTLGVDSRTTVVRGDSLLLAHRGNRLAGPYSLLLLDPPYRIDATEVRGLVEALHDAGALSDDCVVAWEHETGSNPPEPQGFAVQARKRYGSTEVDILVRNRRSNAE